MNNWIDASAIVISCILSGLIGRMIERVRIFKILDNTIDSMDNITGKPVEYRLGYLAALDQIGKGVHDR